MSATRARSVATRSAIACSTTSVHHRELIAKLVVTHTLGDVYDAVAALARRQGYRIRHREYPFGVLGHRVERYHRRHRRSPPLGKITIGGFGLRGLLALGRDTRKAPTLWNDQFAANQKLAGRAMGRGTASRVS